MPRCRCLPLRTVVVQFAPKIGQVQANLARARELVSPIAPRSVDIVCFPEMIMSGYVFENASAISPYLELPHVGPTSQFCAELANRLSCYVFAGYPERLVGDELEEAQTKEDAEERDEWRGMEDGHGKPRIVGANSAVIYGPGGKLFGGYRKSHLFQIDKTWAKPGPGFSTFRLRFPPYASPSPLSCTLTVSVAICMDLNPRTPWISLREGPYELAEHVMAEKVDILILLNAWLDSNEDPEAPFDPDYSTLRYWQQRLRPLWEDPKHEWDPNDPEEMDGLCWKKDKDYDYELDKGEFPGSDWATPSHRKKPETVVIVCNRSGTEKGKLFAGSSAIFHMKQGYGRPNMLESMGRHEEGVKGWGIYVHCTLLAGDLTVLSFRRVFLGFFDAIHATEVPGRGQNCACRHLRHIRTWVQAAILMSHTRSQAKGKATAPISLTEDLKKKFVALYYKKGPLEERLQWIEQNKDLGRCRSTTMIQKCIRCEEQGLECEIVPPSAYNRHTCPNIACLACAACNPASTCSRAMEERKSRLVRLLEITPKEYDTLLDWFELARKNGLVKGKTFVGTEFPSKHTSRNRTLVKEGRNLRGTTNDDPRRLFDDDSGLRHNDLDQRSSPLTDIVSGDEMNAEEEDAPGARPAVNPQKSQSYQIMNMTFLDQMNADPARVMEAMAYNKYVMERSNASYCMQMSLFKKDIDAIAEGIRMGRLSVEEASAGLKKLSQEVNAFAQKCLHTTQDLKGLNIGDMLRMMAKGF
ncbi:hypothetical protein D9758_013170 [Tetrapyrgos nigripes]|uniref:CN hydrolase domain-containing protein n=1 Tax=Tetrapyrgos nigripes TaxID=182062 RepID=A0A8H5CFZ8_9AGAR|nr:hypothetical protein D9758_013170 [Tetrapyrgos nigripes]